MNRIAEKRRGQMSERTITCGAPRTIACFKASCLAVGSVLAWSTAALLSAVAGISTVSIWAGDANWGVSDKALSLLLSVMYMAIPVALDWYATKKEKG